VVRPRSPSRSFGFMAPSVPRQRQIQRHTERDACSDRHIDRRPAKRKKRHRAACGGKDWRLSDRRSGRIRLLEVRKACRLTHRGLRAIPDGSIVYSPVMSGLINVIYLPPRSRSRRESTAGPLPPPPDIAPPKKNNRATAIRHFLF